jgi:hypothetical protein
MLALAVLLGSAGCLAGARASSAPGAATVTLASLTPINTLQPTYASWNIDPSCNRGFHRTAFNNSNLVAGAAALHPSLLRFGGSGADALVYSLTPGAPECSAIDPAVCDANPGYTTPGCLNASHWEGLYALAARSGAGMVFGVSLDLPAACAAGGPSYVWSSANAERLLAYLAAHGQTLYGMELGNVRAVTLRPWRQGARRVSLPPLTSPPLTSRGKCRSPTTMARRPATWRPPRRQPPLRPWRA